MKLNQNKANEKRLNDMPPVLSRPAPSPPAGRGPRKMGFSPVSDSNQSAEAKASLMNANRIRGQSQPQSQPLEMYKPGWSLPKFRLEDLGKVPSPKLSISSWIGPSSQLPPRVPPPPTQPSSKTKKDDMLSRFDTAVSNPNVKVAGAKSTRLRQMIRKDTENKLDGSPSGNKLAKQMTKMREKFLGDISSELGFTYEQDSSVGNGVTKPIQSQKLSAMKLEPAKTDSWSAVSARMDKSLKEWSVDAQKAENREWIRASGSGNLKEKGQTNPVTRPRSRPRARDNPSGTLKSYLEIGTGKSAQRVANSEDKLAVISNRFRKKLQPMASRDVRDLIQTPPDNVLEKLSLQHDEALEERLPQNQMSSTLRDQIQYKPLKSENLKIGNNFTRTSKSIKNNTTQSADVSRAGSQNLAGLMDFRSLLEIQSENQNMPRLQKTVKSNPARTQKQQVVAVVNRQPQYDYERERLSGSEMHGTLTRSVRSIDHAAKVAQNLGNLMSKVAIQNASFNDNDTSLEYKEQPKSNYTSTSTFTTSNNSRANEFTASPRGEAIDTELVDLLRLDRQRNPYNPLTAEIKRGANRLTDVAESAGRNFKLHGALFGITPAESSSMSDGNVQHQNRKTTTGVSTSTTTSTSTGTATEVETWKKKSAAQNPSEFEFVSDMSYTDQLMLKKLRGLKSSWNES